MLTAAEHEARQQRFARILIEEANKLMKAAAASTPATGGANISSSRESGTSLATNKPEVAAVVPPTPDEMPAAAGTDEITTTVKDSLTAHAPRIPSDEIWRISPSGRSGRQRTFYCADSGGFLRIHRNGLPTLELNPAEIDELADFISATATIRGQA